MTYYSPPPPSPPNCSMTVPKTPPPTHYPSYSPPPPPNCNMTTPKTPPPPPPPTHYPPYSPPPPTKCNLTMPPQPPPAPCNCTCPPLPYHHPPPPPPPSFPYSPMAPYPSPIYYEHHYKALVAVSVSLGGILVAFLVLGAFFYAKMKRKPIPPPYNNTAPQCDPVQQNVPPPAIIFESIEIQEVGGVASAGGPSYESCAPVITHDHGHHQNYTQSSS